MRILLWNVLWWPLGGSHCKEVDQEKEWREGAGGSIEELSAVLGWCHTRVYTHLWMEHREGSRGSTVASHCDVFAGCGTAVLFPKVCLFSVLHPPFFPSSSSSPLRPFTSPAPFPFVQTTNPRSSPQSKHLLPRRDAKALLRSRRRQLPPPLSLRLRRHRRLLARHRSNRRRLVQHN